MWRKACFQSCFVQSELCNIVNIIDEIEEILTSFELHVLHQIVSLDKSTLTQVAFLVLSLCTLCMYAVFCDQAPPLTWSWIECGWIVAPAPYRVTTTLLPYLVSCLFSPGNNVFSSPGCIFIIIKLLHQICVPNACLQQYILIQTLVASSCTRVDGPSIHFLHKLCIISIN